MLKPNYVSNRILLDVWEEVVGLNGGIKQTEENTIITLLERRELVLSTENIVIVGNRDSVFSSRRISVIRTENGYCIRAIEESI